MPPDRQKPARVGNGQHGLPAQAGHELRYAAGVGLADEQHLQLLGDRRPADTRLSAKFVAIHRVFPRTISR